MDKNSSVMKVALRNSCGESITVSIYPEDTIQDLKTKIQERAGIPLDFNLLNNNGQKPSEEQRVVDYISGLSQDPAKTDANCSSPALSCIVPGCSNSGTCAGKTFFTLPNSELRRHQWITACKREDLFTNTEDSFAVCSDHFIEEQFMNFPRTRLKEDAIPTVFPLVLPSCKEDCILVSQSICEDEENEELVYKDTSRTMIKLEPDVIVNLFDYISNEDDDFVKHPGQLCRLCASNTGDVIYIFGSAGKELNIANKINMSLPVWVRKTDPLPKQLCSTCVLKLDMCYEFSQSCIVAEEKLKTLMRLNHFWSQTAGDPNSTSVLNTKRNSIHKIDAESPLNGEINIKREACLQTCNSDTEMQENDKYPDVYEQSKKSYCCPLCCEGRVKIRGKEVDTSIADEKSEVCKQSYELCKESDGDSYNGKDGFVTDTNHVSQLQSNVVYELKAGEGNDYALVQSDNGWWNEETIFENAEIIIKTLNPEDPNILCELDNENVNNWNFSDRIEVEINSPNCQLCGESFASEDLCLDHSKAHAEEDCFPCSLCGMFFNNELDITSHCEEHKTEEKKPRTKLPKGRVTCALCGRRFNSEKTLNEHTCGSNEAKQFRCETCKKAYISEERLSFHRKFHEGARPNYCTICGKEFDNEGSLYYHTRMVHEGARPFCCEVCGKRFYSNARLEAHKRVHSGERPFECEVCGRRFYDRETLKGHYITHMSVKPFQCDLCGVCCGRKSLLKQHMRIHHSDSYIPKRVPSLIHYFCKICNETFTSSSDVLTHRTTHWGTSHSATNDTLVPKTHVCEYCGEAFTVVTLLGKHRKREHPDEQPYLCSICKETSRTLYEARVHRKTHTSADDIEGREKIKPDLDKEVAQKMFICEECGKPLPGRRKFVAHMKAHRMDLPFECTVCGRKFVEKQRLLVHMRLHTGEKPFSCSECGKRFTQSSALYTHVLLHTGEKPHSCDLCGKAFRIKADRDNHRRSHTGEKPYKCEFCGKQFRTGQVYYQHRMIHTGERRFPCDICGKAFKRSHTLVVHKRIHTGEKPNICDVCGRGFRQRTDMKKHRALHAVHSE